MTRTDIEAKVTRTAAGNGSGVDISGIPAATDWTLVLEITDLNAEAIIRIGFEDSVDAFSAKLAGPVVSLVGPIRGQAEKRRYTFSKRDFPDLRFGVSSAVLRSGLFKINTDGTETCTYHTYLEY